MNLGQNISSIELELIISCAKNIKKHLERVDSNRSNSNITEQLSYVNQLIDNKLFKVA